MEARYAKVKKRDQHMRGNLVEIGASRKIR